jgi:acyl-CoA reductase-like NAD-dependent aldehyde dehydrogenase
MIQLTLTINGKGVAGQAQPFAVINPATEQPITECPAASSAQIDAAVNAARQAFPAWKQTSIEQRRELLYHCAKIILANSEGLSALLTREQGKPLSNAQEEVESAVEELQSIAKISIPNVILQDDAQGRVEVRHKPLGVVAAITPWNYPVYIAINNIGMALLAGNTIVIKPSPYTPLTTLRIGELLREVIPAGVLNVVSGGDEVGAQLTQHPHIKLLLPAQLQQARKLRKSLQKV